MHRTNELLTKVGETERSIASPHNGLLKLQISRSFSDPKWDAFLSHVSGGHHVQTSLWAQTKAVLKWEPFRIVVTEGERIVGGGQLLFRSIAPTIRVAYLTKAPIVERSFSWLTKTIIQQTIDICRAAKVKVFSIQPPDNGDSVAALLPGFGFQRTSLELAPTASILIDLSLPTDQILGQMKRQTRQNIRRSQRDGIVVREGTAGDIGVFYRLHLRTSKRQGFSPYPLAYFVRMWEVFKASGSIKLFIAELKDESISALLTIPFGDTVVPKIFGWSGLHADRKPNDAVFWAAIQWAKKEGYRFLDMEGIDREGAESILQGNYLPEQLRYSPDFFKIGFGGQIVLYPLAYRLVSGRLFRSIYQTTDPKIGGRDLASRLMDHLRKR